MPNTRQSRKNAVKSQAIQLANSEQFRGKLEVAKQFKKEAKQAPRLAGKGEGKKRRDRKKLFKNVVKNVKKNIKAQRKVDKTPYVAPKTFYIKPK